MSTEAKKTKLLWVHAVNGQPRVRWKILLIYVLIYLFLQLTIFAAMNWLLKTPMSWGIPLILFFATLAGLTCLVEFQRQAIFAGKPRFRLGFAASLILLTFIGGFFAMIGNELRYTQRAFAANQKLKSELEAIMGSGNAYISSLDGRGITCNVTNKSFSDDDLRKLINRATRQGSDQCEISTLFIFSTAVTNRGLTQLSDCENLESLVLPDLALSDEAIAAIGKCHKLKHLMLVEKKISTEQLNQLKQLLPNVQVNGKSWKVRVAGNE